MHVTRDLFDTCLLVRHWGSLSSKLGNSLIEIVVDEQAAQLRIHDIEKERAARKPPYLRVL